MNYKKLIILALLLPCLLLPAAGSEPVYVAPLEEGSTFLRDMTTAPLSELCSLRDVTASYLDAQRGYAFLLEVSGAWSDGSPITADQLREAILAEAPDWLALTQPEPAADPIPLKEAGYATLEEAAAAGHSRFYLDIQGFWGLDARWLPISSQEKFRDTAMASGALEYYVNPSYLYRNYLAPGTGYERWQGEFLGICPEETGAESPRLLITEEGQLVLFTAQPMAPSALALKLSAIYPRAGEGLACGPYRQETLENGEVLLTRNPHYTGPRAADYPDAIICR